MLALHILRLTAKSRSQNLDLKQLDGDCLSFLLVDSFFFIKFIMERAHLYIQGTGFLPLSYFFVTSYDPLQPPEQRLSSYASQC